MSYHDLDPKNPQWLHSPVVLYSPRPLTDISVASSPLHLWVDELSGHLAFCTHSFLSCKLITYLTH